MCIRDRVEPVARRRLKPSFVASRVGGLGLNTTQPAHADRNEGGVPSEHFDLVVFRPHGRVHPFKATWSGYIWTFGLRKSINTALRLVSRKGIRSGSGKADVRVAPETNDTPLIPIAPGGTPLLKRVDPVNPPEHPSYPSGHPSEHPSYQLMRLAGHPGHWAS